MNWLRAILDRLADWYWRDPIARARHQVECDVRRLGGTVTWRDNGRST